MEKELRNWIGTLGALAIIGALTLGALPVSAKGPKAGSRPSVLVTKRAESRTSATHAKAAHAKKTGSRPSAAQSKKSGGQDKATQDKKAPKTSRAKLPEGTKVNINTATAEELAKLPHVGAKAAQRIVEYRSAHTSFKSVDELRNVKGIGPKVIEGIRPYATL